MTTKINDAQGDISAPVVSAVAITPNDSTDLAKVSRGLYVGTAGNVQLIFDNDAAPVTLTNLAAGLYPFRVKRVYLTSTSASGLIALY